MEGNSEISARSAQTARDNEINEDTESFRRARKNQENEITDKEMKSMFADLGNAAESLFSDNKIGKTVSLEADGRIYRVSDEIIGGFGTGTDKEIRSWKIEVPNDVSFATNDEPVKLNEVNVVRDKHGWFAQVKSGDSARVDIDQKNWRKFGKPLNTLVSTIKNSRKQSNMPFADHGLLI